MAQRTAVYRRSSAALLLFLFFAASCSRPDSPRQGYQRLWEMYVSGNLPKTIQAVSREADRWKDRRNSTWFWQFHLLHVEALLAQGKTSQASDLLAGPVPAIPALIQLSYRRQVDLAHACLLSDRTRAMEMLDQAAALVSDPDLRLRIHLLKGAGWLAAHDIDRAQEEFETVRRQAAAGRNPYREAGALNNLSLCLRNREQYEKAVALASEAVDKAGQARASMVQAQAHNNLGNYYLYLGNLSDASKHLQQALKLFEAIDARADLAVNSNVLGLVYSAQADVARATQSHERAYGIAIGLAQKNEAARYALNLSLDLLQDKQWASAETWNQKAAGLVVSPQTSPLMPFIVRNRARIADGQGNAPEAITACRTLLAESQKNPILRWEAYAILANIDARSQRFAKSNEEFAAALATIDGARAQLETPQNRITLLSRLIPFYRDYVDSLASQGNDPKALTVTESSRARELAEALRRNAEPMAFDSAALTRLAATTRSSIVSFWLAPERSFAWLITPREVHRYVLPPDKDIEALMAAYRNSVEHSWSDPLHDAAGAKLWDALLKEIAPRIPHGTRVIVIPDGSLHRLNLETLPVPGPSPHYWLEDVEVAVAPSMTLLAGSAAPSASAPSLLVMGAPVAVASFPKLPQADAEVAAIQNRFPDMSKAVFTGATATVSSYQNAQPGRFSLIHFAAHAEPNPESPLESAIVLSPEQGRYLLKARDIVDSQLHADLVTISACRSAGARIYAGEGLIGLAWAFLEAGSRSVIAGLWDVNDGSSRLLMDQLYAGIAAGQPPAIALHNAKLALLGGDPRFRKPYFWGPFQAYVRSVR